MFPYWVTPFVLSWKVNYSCSSSLDTAAYCYSLSPVSRICRITFNIKDWRVDSVNTYLSYRHDVWSCYSCSDTCCLRISACSFFNWAFCSSVKVCSTFSVSLSCCYCRCWSVSWICWLKNFCRISVCIYNKSWSISYDSVRSWSCYSNMSIVLDVTSINCYYPFQALGITFNFSIVFPDCSTV